MADLPFFRSVLGEVMEPGLGFLETLGDLVEALDEEQVESLLAFLTGNEDDDSSELPAAANLSDDIKEKLRDFALRLGEKKKLRATLEQLDKPISELSDPDGMGWAWAPGFSIPQIPAGSVSFHVGVDAELEARIKPTPAPLTFMCRGAFGVEGGVAIPFQYGSLSIDAAARGAVGLEYRFEQAPDTRLLEALLTCLPRLGTLTNPLELFAPLDAGRVESAMLDVSGQVQLGAELSAGRSWSTTRSVTNGNATGDAIALTAAVGLQYGLRWSMAGEYQVLISGSETEIEVELSEKKTSEHGRSLSIGANLKIDGLDKVVLPVIDQFADRYPGELMKLVEEYSKPSEKLRTALSEALSDVPGEFSELLTVLSGQSDASDLHNKLAGWLGELANERLSNWTGLLEGEVGSLADKALARLAPALGDLVDPEDIRDQLRKLLNKGGAKLQEKLLASFKDVLADVGAPAVRALEGFGARADTALNDLDAAVAELLEPLTSLMAKFRALREKLTDAVEAVSREQLGVRFTREVTSSDESAALLHFTLNPGDERARRLYQQMLIGDFAESIEAGVDDTKSFITLVDGTFSDRVARSRTVGFTFDLFGFEVGVSDILTSEVQIEYDANGRISVFDSKASLKKVRRGFGESQSVRLSSTLNLLDASSQGVTPLSVRLNYQDEDLDQTELGQFLGSLEKAGLIAAGTTLGLTSSYDSLGVPDRDGDRALNLDLAFALEGADLDRLHALDESQILETSVAVQLELFRGLSSGNRKVLQRLEAKRPEGARRYILSRRGQGGKVKDEARKMYNLARHKGISLDAKKLWHFVNRAASNADGLVEYLDGRAELLQKEFPALSATQRFPMNELKKIDEQHRSIVEELSGWMDVRDAVRGLFQERVSIWSLAFLVTLGRLLDRDLSTVPIVSWKTKDGETQKLIFAPR